jgi:glutamine---fructose-6-phosphate transaminase (isomerizing)
MDQCEVVGRGYNYATAFELALKLKELTYIMATAYSSADFRHGPIATVSPGLPVILIMPDGVVYPDMLSLARELRERGAELLIITDQPAAHPLATTLLELPAGLPEWLTPITAIVPGQLLALHLALAKGLDADAPRGLRKVTLTL